MIKNTKHPKRTAPKAPPKVTENCPACHSLSANIDRSMLQASRAEMRATIAARRASRSGDLAEVVQAEDFAKRLQAEAENAEPEAGSDRCPACGAEGIVVDRSALSPVGQTAMLAARQETTTSQVDEIRRRRTAESVAAMEEHNKQAAKRRAALRGPA